MKLEEFEITSINNQYEIAEKITIDESVYEQFRIYTKLYGASEWGGVCIGYQKDKTFHVRAIVLPPQKIQSGGYCEFRKEIFPLVTKQILHLTADEKDLFNYRSGVWIHTHPGLGVFFSGTDFNSFKYLTALSPDFLAVVVDPLRNEIIGYNGKLTTKTKEVPVKPTEEDEEAGYVSEKATEPVEIEEFTEVVMKIIKPDLSNETELTFLKELRQVLQSNASAKEIGDTEHILAFIPIEDSELKMNTMAMKVDYLESQIAKIETRPTYSKDLQYETILQLHSYAQTHNLDSDIVIPHALIVKPEGILYVYSASFHRLSAGLVKWEDIEDIEGLILLERTTNSQGYPTQLQVILLKIKHKKSGLFSKRPKDIQLLYLCVDSNNLFRTLIEYQPSTSFYSFPPEEKPIEKKKKDDDEELDDDKELDDEPEDSYDDSTSDDEDEYDEDEMPIDD
ncbi:MAG: hypothetical protein E4H14_05095 [Candidatus Thorarchaeota archaeon]|nr:MAG: hypothetical protein E4H14_05095 [Candidatus Thorarchaeota archaeon]